MDIVKVSVKVGDEFAWSMYFDGLPTLEKLTEIAGSIIGRYNRRVIAVLEAAKPVMISSSFPQNKFFRWRTPVVVAGTRVGTIVYEKMQVHTLNKRTEQVGGFKSMRCT